MFSAAHTCYTKTNGILSCKCFHFIIIWCLRVFTPFSRECVRKERQPTIPCDDDDADDDDVNIF